MLKVTGTPGDTGLGLAVTVTVRDSMVVGVVTGTVEGETLVLGVDVVDVVVVIASF